LERSVCFWLSKGNGKGKSGEETERPSVADNDDVAAVASDDALAADPSH